MADTTITSTAVKSVTTRSIHAGTYAITVSHTLATTPSASQMFYMIPLQSGVRVLDGWVKSTGLTSFSMDIMVGVLGDKSYFMAGVESSEDHALRFHRNLGHVVTLTDSDSFPLTKPLAVTIKAAASGTIGATPAITVMAMLQYD